MTTRTSDVLAVWLDGRLVGHLTRTNEGSRFEFTDEYLASANRPVLGQYFEESPSRPQRVRYGTPRWFSNLLPEGRLRELIAERAGVHPDRSYQLLELIGLDLPGAVLIRRDGEPPNAPPDDSDDPDDPGDEPLLKFSLAGVQLKFSANRQGRGLTIPAHGRGGDWIVKLPDERHDGVPENEFSIMSWATQSGLNVPEIALFDVADIEGLPPELPYANAKAFGVQRFDRLEGGQRVHIEDFAQVLNRSPRSKYKQTSYDHIGKVLAALAPEDVQEYVRRLAFLVISGNGDAHLKNWSLIYRDGVTARLSPAYDLISTVDYIEGDGLGLALGRTKRFADIDVERLRRFAERAGIDDSIVVETALQQAARSIDTWTSLRDELPALEPVKRRIDERLLTLPLATAV